jgi:hypothetical protein
MGVWWLSVSQDRVLLYGALALVIAYVLYLILDTETTINDLPDSRMAVATGSYPGVDVNKIYQLAYAICVAEGFFVSGSIPNRANNPGDLELGDIGNGTINGVTVYGSTSDGWNALYNEVYLILSGNSSIYSPSMSISQIAASYTATQQAAWASNVSQTLGIDPSEPLTDWLAT